MNKHDPQPGETYKFGHEGNTRIVTGRREGRIQFKFECGNKEFDVMPALWDEWAKYPGKYIKLEKRGKSRVFVGNRGIRIVCL